MAGANLLVVRRRLLAVKNNQSAVGNKPTTACNGQLMTDHRLSTCDGAQAIKLFQQRANAF
jgi:hypothetical protein